MTQRSATHATFAIERVYPHEIARVFRAFADPAAKKKWFAPPQEGQLDRHSMDFRVGGREVNGGGMHGGLIRLAPVWHFVGFGLAMVALLLLAPSAAAPFIYFQF